MALYLPAADLQLARGESYRDTALVLSRFVSALLIRTFEQSEVDTFAEHASIPVINGLTDLAHPLQALADAMTIRERLGGLEGVRITYLGDGNNVCHSLMRISARLGMHFTAACPPGYEPAAEVVAGATADAVASGGSVRLTTDPLDGAEAADVLYTDVWTSMGQEEQRGQRLLDLERFRLDGELLSVASREARRDALPPGPRRRGDQRGRALRPSRARLGPGGEPPPHAEGGHGPGDPLGDVRRPRRGGSRLAASPPRRRARQHRGRRRGRAPGRSRSVRPLRGHAAARARRYGGRASRPDHDLPAPAGGRVRRPGGARAARSGSRSFTSSGTTSASTRIVLRSSVTNDDRRPPDRPLDRFRGGRIRNRCVSVAWAPLTGMSWSGRALDDV